METAEAAIKLISTGATLLTDEKQKEFFEGILKSLEVAKTEANNEEKEARYIDASVKYANQISFILFRKGALSDEMEAELRELPTPEDTAAKVAEHVSTRSINSTRRSSMKRKTSMYSPVSLLACLKKMQKSAWLSTKPRSAKPLSKCRRTKWASCG